MATTCRNQEETSSRRSELWGAFHEQSWWKYHSGRMRSYQTARYRRVCRRVLACQALKLNALAASVPGSSHERRWSSAAKRSPAPHIKILPALIWSGRCLVFISGRRCCTCLLWRAPAVLQLPLNRLLSYSPSLLTPQQIMNKIIFVCSIKFLPHFPPPMLILFKVYQLENILCNLNANDSSKYVWGVRYITQRGTYCLFFFFFIHFHLLKCLSTVLIQELGNVWKTQLGKACTCECDLYTVRMLFVSPSFSRTLCESSRASNIILNTAVKVW